MATEPFDWSQYLTVAEDLASRADDASQRSSLSRAYYYIYHLAFSRATENGFTIFPGEGTHKQLWRHFVESPEPECQRLGQIAGRLKEKRERADYNDFYPRLADEIPVMLAEARDFANLLSRLRRGLPKPIHIRN